MYSFNGATEKRAVMLDRDKIMEELVEVFGEAWGKENSSRHPQSDYPRGSRREAGLHAVLDVLEAKYITLAREDIDD